MISKNIGTDKCAHCSRSESEAHHPDCPNHAANREKLFDAEVEVAARERAIKAIGESSPDLEAAFVAGAKWAKARQS